MTTPFPTLPNVSMGNLGQDLSVTGAAFIKGLQDEKERRRQAAMDEALLSIRGMEAQGKLMGQSFERPFLEAGIDPKTRQRQYFRIDPRQGGYSESTGVQAPEPPPPPQQFRMFEDPLTGDRSLIGLDRWGGQNPVQPQNPNAPGQTLRPAAPEYLSRPGVGEIKTARETVNMMIGISGINNVIRAKPEMLDIAAKYLAAQNIAEAVPLFGSLISDIIGQARSSLPPEAAQLVNHWMNYAQARAFSKGGATLTRNEIKYGLDGVAPRAMEDPVTTANRMRTILQDIQSGMAASGPAWARVQGIDYVKGLMENLQIAPLGRFDPMQQMFYPGAPGVSGGGMVTPPVAPRRFDDYLNRR